MVNMTREARRRKGKQALEIPSLPLPCIKFIFMPSMKLFLLKKMTPISLSL